MHAREDHRLAAAGVGATPAEPPAAAVRPVSRRQPAKNRGKILGKALVLGDDTRSFLAIVRSLGRSGIQVHAAPADFTAPALRSRYIAALHWLPPYVGDGAEWCEQAGDLLRREQFDLVISCDERTILPFHHHRARFEGLARLAIPDPDVLEVLFDKEKTRQLAAAHNVPLPPGRAVRPTDTAARLIGEFGLPLVLKPCRSYRLEALHVRGRATIHASESSLAAALADIGDVPHLVEHRFDGAGGGLSVLASRGRVLQAFQHLRARERDGAGFYRVSAPVTPDILDAVQRMVGALGFTGLAMFEFKIAFRSKEWVLLEVNARPWGSMPLPLALGVDFPLRWYRLLVEGDETGPCGYRAGVYGRNLLPDTRQIFAEAYELRHRPAAMVRHLLAAAAQAGHLATGRERLDVLVADDPRPALSEIGQAGTELAHRLLGRFPGSRRLRTRRDRRRLYALLRHAKGAPAMVTVVCQGNICRSPFAAELLQGLLAGRVPDVRVRAAGLLPRAGARSPAAAIAAARQLGVGLDDHRSTNLSRGGAVETTVAVVFDQRNRDAISAQFPALLPRTVMLGSFLPDRYAPQDIEDPDGGDLATFQRTYALVAAAVTELASAIARARAA